MLITLSYRAQDLTFDVQKSQYDKLQEFFAAGKTEGATNRTRNFLVRAVLEEHRDALIEIVDNVPESEGKLMLALRTAYVPEDEVIVKKSSPSIDG